ncbi:MAG TPA: TonB family protein [Allosphingosinicella sp.]
MEGATTYQAKRGSPTALTVVVLLHGAAIGALALSKMDVIHTDFGRTEVYTVPLDTPKPPPEPPKPVEKSVETPQHVSTVTRPQVIVPISDPVDTFDTTPVVIPPTIEYTRPAETYIAPPPPPPPPPPPRTVEPARAKANLGSYVSDADYPAAAIRSVELGRTAFRLTVGADGRVKECSIVGSSGSSALDNATCKIMKQRARFQPARNSAGQETTDTVQSSIKWVLPE